MWKEVGALGEEGGGISGSRNTNGRTGDGGPLKGWRGLDTGYARREQGPVTRSTEPLVRQQVRWGSNEVPEEHQGWLRQRGRHYNEKKLDV